LTGKTPRQILRCMRCHSPRTMVPGRGLRVGLAAALVLTTIAASHPTDGADAALLQPILAHGPWPMTARVDPSNRVDGSAAAVEFGYRMFRESRLSANGYVSCVTCHQLDRAFTDGNARAQALAPLDHNTLALANVPLQRRYGWDGASDSLWMASLRPLFDPREFGADAARVAHVVRIGDGLACRYQHSFAAPPATHDDQTVMVNVAKALAAFVATLGTGRTPFDEYRDALTRNDRDAVAAFAPAARRGAAHFVGVGGCAACHSGPNFSDGALHPQAPAQGASGAAAADGAVGSLRWSSSAYNLHGPFNDNPAQTASTEGALVSFGTGTGALVRTPSLRNVAVTAPYMHDGSVATLRSATPHAGAELTTAQVNDIVAFLGSLTDRQGAVRSWPQLAVSPCP